MVGWFSLCCCMMVGGFPLFQPKGFQLKTSCANLPSCLSHQRHLDAAPGLIERRLKNATKWQLQPILTPNRFSSAFAFSSHLLIAFNLQLETSVFSKGEPPACLHASDFWQQLKELVWRDGCCVPRPVSWLQIGPIVLSSQPGCPHLTFQVVQVSPLTNQAWGTRHSYELGDNRRKPAT